MTATQTAEPVDVEVEVMTPEKIDHRGSHNKSKSWGKPFVTGDPRIFRKKGLTAERRDWYKWLRKEIFKICKSTMHDLDKRKKKQDPQTYLQWLALRHPQAFSKLIAKLIPNQIEGLLRHEHAVNLRFPDLIQPGQDGARLRCQTAATALLEGGEPDDDNDAEDSDADA